CRLGSGSVCGPAGREGGGADRVGLRLAHAAPASGRDLGAPRGRGLLRRTRTFTPRHPRLRESDGRSARGCATVESRRLVRGSCTGCQRRELQMTAVAYLDASIRRVSANNGIEYAYRDLADGDVPLVLLQHFRGNLDNWDPALVDALAANRRVVTFDNVGVG